MNIPCMSCVIVRRIEERNTERFQLGVFSGTSIPEGSRYPPRIESYILFTHDWCEEKPQFTHVHLSRRHHKRHNHRSRFLMSQITACKTCLHVRNGYLLAGIWCRPFVL